MIHIRPAMALDAGSMARLLNAIIDQGGSTSITDRVSSNDLADWMAANDGRAAWHVAVNDSEEVVGFQWIESADYLPPQAAEIATFVRIGQTGLGIGSRLFDATKAAARTIGYKWINANIRSDNVGGLVYYQSRGFQDYGKIDDYEMSDGHIVDKVLKRYDL